MERGIANFLNNNSNEINPAKVRTPATNSVLIKNFNKSPQEQYLALATTFFLTPDMMDAVDNSGGNETQMTDSNNPDVEIAPETRCICTLTHGSPLMIQCDSCKKWLHEDCVHLKNPKDANPFICIYCQYEMAKAVKQFIRRRILKLYPDITKLEGDPNFSNKIHQIWDEITLIAKDTFWIKCSLF